MQFDFIHDQRFRSILERDYEEIHRCLEIKAAKSILLLSGSIIEAVLSDYFAEHLPNGKTKVAILNASLFDLIQLAESEGLITSKEKHLSEVIKNYRNLIHPGKEVRTKEEFDFDTANLSKILLDIILKKIRSHHLEKYSYTAADVLQKLVTDWQFHSIYSLIIPKLDHVQRGELLIKLIDFEIKIKSDFKHYQLEPPEVRGPAFDYGELYDVKGKIQLLKPLINEELIIKMLSSLKHAVMKEDSVRVLSLYNLFHEDLFHLEGKDQQIIAGYILTLFESIYENASDLVTEKTYSTIGKYLNTPEGLNMFCRFSESRIVNSGSQTAEYEAEVYQQMFNSFSPDQQLKIQDAIYKFLPESRKELEQHGITTLYDELVKRKIISEKY